MLKKLHQMTDCVTLTESFGQNYPEENDGTLDCVTMALTAQFNRFGTLLAVGCNDGRIVVWDFLTRSGLVSGLEHDFMTEPAKLRITIGII